MKKTNKAIGAALKLHREGVKGTLRQVQARTGVNANKLSRIERGMNGLSFAEAVRLCRVYGIRLPALASLVIITKKGKIA